VKAELTCMSAKLDAEWGSFSNNVSRYKKR
jgi:hypothetical protein